MSGCTVCVETECSFCCLANLTLFSEMYNLFFLLLCVILAILFGKMINVDIPIRPRPLARTGGYIERGNFTYFYVHYQGPVLLNLTSLSGDADLYVSDKNMFPTYDPEIYALHSATCGEDVIEVPESFGSPLAVAVYGHAESSDFLLEIYENPKNAYPYKQWVNIDKEIENFKNTQENKVETFNDNNKKSDNTQTLKKKKKGKSSSNIPGVFSVLEILQLIFL